MRSYVMELIGTFLLTFVIIFSAEPTVVGLFFMSLIYVGIHISGAFYNPAMTVAAFIRGKLSLHKAGIYMAMQFAGAAAALTLYVRIMAFTWGNDIISPD